jgi:molybdopterin/thiamine biosynthesis adenylyltransferase
MRSSLTSQPLFAITRDVLTLIRDSSEPGGDLEFGYWKVDDIYVVTKVETTPNLRIGVEGFKASTSLSYAGQNPIFTGQWLKSQDEWAHVIHRMLQARPGTLVPLDEFRAKVSYVSSVGTGAYMLLMVNDALPEDLLEIRCQPVIGWKITPDGAEPAQIAVENDNLGLRQLVGSWPVEALQQASVAVVGVGSIGGRIAEALTAYGVGYLTMVDPDRFLWHNSVRHVLDNNSVGRFKVDAMKEHLEKRWPLTELTALQWSVITHAALLRPLMARLNLVVCAADGIGPRRAASHLAKRANVPAVFACVLEDGAYGEILRQRPGPRFSCLLCHRQHLERAGSMDIEAAQEAGYGDGDLHRPMTAVGPDLALIGSLAAKVSVATLLEAAGDEQHRLPGDYATIGLRPNDQLATPFDFNRSAQVNWHEVPPPLPGCPTCRTR